MNDSQYFRYQLIFRIDCESPYRIERVGVRHDAIQSTEVVGSSSKGKPALLSATPQRGRTPSLTPVPSSNSGNLPTRGGYPLTIIGIKMTMSHIRQLSPSSTAVALLSLTGALWPTSALAGNINDNNEGYKLREDIPVSCLNRTM